MFIIKILSIKFKCGFLILIIEEIISTPPAEPFDFSVSVYSIPLITPDAIGARIVLVPVCVK